jgi:hypothetical protein
MNIRKAISVVSCCVIAALSATLAARWLSGAPRQPTVQTDETAVLWIPAESLDFGTVYEDEYLSWTLPIENHKPVSVEIESFSTSCNCLLIDPPTLTIGPSERRDLRLKVDLTSKSRADDRVEVRFVAKVKEGMIEGKRSLAEWKLVGNVRSVLSEAVREIAISLR